MLWDVDGRKLGLVGDGGRFFGGHAHDVICRGRIADVAESVFVVRSKEEDRAWACGFGVAIDRGFDAALFDDNDLFVGMAMRGMRGFAGVQGRGVNAETAARDGGGFEEFAAGSLWRGLNGELRPFVNAGAEFVC